MVEIGEANRTIQREHTLALTPLGNSIQQRLEHVVVVDKIKPSEATLLNPPCIVGTMVYDTHYAAHYLPIAVGYVCHKVAHLECWIALGIEGVKLIEEYRRTIVWITLV